MSRRLMAVLAVTVLAGSPATADAPAGLKKDLIGKWERTAGDTTITFEFKADGMTAKIANNAGNFIEVTADYGVTKGGILYGVVTKVEKQGIEGGPTEGDLFSFQAKVDQKTLTVEDVKGTQVSEDAKQLVQGEYKKK